ncbi:hypothetical protein LPJ55_003257 [Coemansia sp. RSA 990]|nr:hypothetical protein LPJ55_003257 [Coemansia sp. RSA 990]
MDYSNMDMSLGHGGYNDDSWAITRFFREEVFHPKKIGSNIGISALFNFQSLLLVVLLTICTCTYLRAQAPTLIDRNKTGVMGLFWKAARIGERLSPYVSLACFIMAFQLIVY